jgi:Flp pilus assembly protein TadB
LNKKIHHMSEEEIEIKKFKAQMEILAAQQEEKKALKKERDAKKREKEEEQAKERARIKANSEKWQKERDAKLRKELEAAERKEAASAKKFNARISGRYHRRMDKILIASSIAAGVILLATVGLGWTIAIAIAAFVGIVLFL